MKSARIALRYLVAAALCWGVVPSVTTLAADVAPVFAQQIIAPKAALNVESILWTRRSDRYTLQIVFPRPTTTGIRIQPIKIGTNVTLWLLKADGTAIPTNVVLDLPKRGVVENEAAYWVSLAVGEAAVAAAFKINDEYFIEALRPLN